MKVNHFTLGVVLLLADSRRSIALSGGEKKIESDDGLIDFRRNRGLKSFKYPVGKATEKGHKKISKTVKKLKSKKAVTAKDECGTNYCENKVINLGGMETCLMGTFNHMSNLYFPDDGDAYLEARQTAYSISRFPAAIVYVENEEEAKNALLCAVNNGYKVSVRGGNHSYQGFGTMDGYVVIDMGRTCNPEEFVIDKKDQGPHILEGSKYIGTMKAQAGCTNAIMLAAGHEHFKDDGGMTLIGACPSVGITGFVLGGGAGDVSPYLGYAADIVKEVQLILYNGTVVKASEEENPDLYWASRGGGGGNGVVTHLTYKIIQAPKQKYEEEEGKKFTNFHLNIHFKDIEKGAARIQEWFYDADPQITAKFGGGAGWDGSSDTKYFYLRAVYLGSWREAIEDLISTGLIDHDMFDYNVGSYLYPSYERVGFARITENYNVICSADDLGGCPVVEEMPEALTSFLVPGSNTTGSLPFMPAYQFDSYGEAEAFHICVESLFTHITWYWSQSSGDFCKDLGIDDNKCEDRTDYSQPFRAPISCLDKDVIDAILASAIDPSSFINSHGPSVELMNSFNYSVSDGYNVIMETRPTPSGASMFPRFDDSFFAKLINETKEDSNHLQHGACLQVHPDVTAYPWRNAAFMVEYDSITDAVMYLKRIVKGGYNAQGYYNYLNPPGLKKWRSYFFGDNWRRLSEIRAKYDPTDVFGKPMTIESLGE